VDNIVVYGLYKCWLADPIVIGALNPGPVNSFSIVSFSTYNHHFADH